MATAYTSLLGLALPVTGELSGTWGATVNDEITALLDSAVAGTTSITVDADITLSDTDGAANETRQAVILWNPAAGTTTRNITAPARSKAYIVINASGGTQSIVLRGAGPTTGVTIVKGEKALCAWNGSDFVKISNTTGDGTFTNLTVTGNTTLGDADTDTITQTASYVTGTQLKSAKTATNTLNLAAYDTDGAAYTNLITLTASTTPTLALTSTGVGTINNMSVGATTASTGAFTTLTSNGATTFTAGTASTSTTTGTAVITGGLGVSGRINAANFDGIVGANTADAGSFTTLSATGNVTLGDASTDTVTVNGYMGVGATPAANIGIRVSRTLTGNSQEWGVYADPTFDSSATSIGGSVGSKPATAAASFTVSTIFGFRALDATKGAGSTITSQHGLYIDDQTQGTNNYGITSAVTSGTNKFNIYANGTASNYFAGTVQFAAGTAALPALTRFGDENTGIFFPAADTIAFSEGGAESMRIDSSGNVGIGTTTTTSKFEVYGGDSRFTSTTNNLSILTVSANDQPTLRLGQSGNNSYISAGTTGGQSTSLIFQTAVTSAAITEKMRITSAGDVGIGNTPSGTYKLEVTGGFSATGNAVLGDATTDTVTVNGCMGVGGAASTDNGIRVTSSALVGGNQTGVISLPTITSAATTTGNGVSARVSTAATAFTVTNLQAFYAYDAIKGAGSTITNQHGLYIVDQTQGTNNFGITSTVTSGTNKFNIYASGTANNAFAGNVRIGSVTAPTNALDVTGNVTVSGNTTLGDADTDTITQAASYVTGTQLKSAKTATNTLALAAYDVDGTAYTNLITLTASNTPTLALTSTGVGTINNMSVGATTASTGAFTTLTSNGATTFTAGTASTTTGTGTLVITGGLGVSGRINAANFDGIVGANTAAAGTFTTLSSTGNTTIGDADTDTITVNGQFVTGTQLKSAKTATNTLSLAAYDVDGTAYTNLITLTASNTPTLALTSTGVGTINNMSVGATTASTGAFTTLSATGNITLGDADTDTITQAASYVTGTVLRSAKAATNTLALAAYDVDGTAYTNLVTLTASNTPTLALTSTGVGTINNMSIGATTASTGAFTTLTSNGATTFTAGTASTTTGTGTLVITGGLGVSGRINAANLDGIVGANTAAAGTFTTLSSTGNTTIGDAVADTITVNGQFVTGTVLRSAQTATNTLALAAYDTDGAAYTNLITLTASTTPTLALTSTGVGTINNMSVGATTASTGAFTTLTSNGATTFTAGTASTSTTTGTAVITGGLGVSGRINAANFDGIVGANTAAAGSFTTLSATGVTTVQAGTVSLPAITTSGDTNTGIFFPAADTIAFTEGGAEAMRIDSSGNVGIGTSSPQARLTVQDVGAGANIGVMVRNGDATNFHRIGIGYNAGATTGYIPANAVFVEGSAGGGFGALGGLAIGTGSSAPVIFGTNATERMRIDTSGNLLVGTTSGSDRLFVKGAGTSSAAASITIQNSAGTELMRIRNDGVFYTGGATFSPYNNTTGSAANMVVGAAGDLFRSTSSIKYKKNIVNTTHGLTELLKLRAVTYEGKSEADEGKTFGGLIAEEVHEAGLIEFVQYAEDGSPDALAYGNMISLCIKAIQEQQALITALTARITALESN